MCSRLLICSRYTSIALGRSPVGFPAFSGHAICTAPFEADSALKDDYFIGPRLPAKARQPFGSETFNPLAGALLSTASGVVELSA